MGLALAEIVDQLFTCHEHARLLQANASGQHYFTVHTCQYETHLKSPRRFTTP